MLNEKLTKDNNKSSVSQASSYEAIGEYWDNHDSSEYLEKSESIDFEIDPNAQGIIYYGIDIELAEKISLIANNKGISGENLLLEWLKDRLKQESIV
jgi:hypothetical protein